MRAERPRLDLITHNDDGTFDLPFDVVEGDRVVGRGVYRRCVITGYAGGPPDDSSLVVEPVGASPFSR